MKTGGHLVFLVFIHSFLLQALCDFNPDINLKKAYDSKMSSARTQPRVDHTHPRLPSPSNAAVSSGASNKLLSVEKGPCEYCQKVVPLSELIKHEVDLIIIPQVTVYTVHYYTLCRLPVVFIHGNTHQMLLHLLQPQ